MAYEATPVPSDVIAALLGPALPGASCAGKWPSWDEWLPGESPTAREKRIARAITLCRSCPALSACRELRSTMPDGRGGPSGVWAGELVTTSSRPPRHTAA